MKSVLISLFILPTLCCAYIPELEIVILDCLHENFIDAEKKLEEIEFNEKIWEGEYLSRLEDKIAIDILHSYISSKLNEYEERIYLARAYFHQFEKNIE